MHNHERNKINDFLYIMNYKCKIAQKKIVQTLYFSENVTGFHIGH